MRRERIVTWGCALSNVIDITVGAVAQLFETLDPFPFRERDLSQHVDEYITNYAEELPKDQPFELVVHLPPGAARTEAANGLDTAITHFFAYRAEVVSRELTELFRLGRRALLIGSVVLALCLLAGQTATNLLPYGHVANFLEEGFVIVGWVAYWRPLEIFLYDWWPIHQRKKLYRRLAEAKVRIVFDQKTAAAGHEA